MDETNLDRPHLFSFPITDLNLLAIYRRHYRFNRHEEDALIRFRSIIDHEEDALLAGHRSSTFSVRFLADHCARQPTRADGVQASRGSHRPRPLL